MQTLIEETVENSLEGLLREGARRMLQAALDMEVATYIEQCKEQVDGNGHRQVVRNGHHVPREVITGVVRFRFGSRGSMIGGRISTLPARSYRRICAARPVSTR